MLVGLRQAWASKEFREEPASDGNPEEPLFLHERLFDIAEGSVVRAGACLELCARSGAIDSDGFRLGSP
jgi:hypothetical protein